jgi:hypothetical protein
MSWPQACITGTVFPSRSVDLTLLAIRYVGRFLDGQRIHIRAQHHRRPVAIAQHPDDAGLTDTCRHLIAGGAQALRRESGGAHLLHRQLGVCWRRRRHTILTDRQ